MTTPEPSQPRVKRWTRRLRDYFLVERELDEAAARAPSLRAALQENIDVAERRIDAARLLRESGRDHAALIFFRQAALLLAKAYVDLKHGQIEPAAPAPEELVQKLVAIVEGERRPAPRELARDLSSLVAGGAEEVAGNIAGNIDRLPAREARLRAEAADATTRWLSGLVALRSRRELRATRALRISVALLALLAIPVARAVWVVSPTNISFNKRVSASSHTPSSNLQGVVDDQLYGLPVFQSLEENAPWVSIDLGRRYLISDAEVFGRHDCCFDQSVPLAFEISDDDVSYRTVATRTEPFVSLLPWVVKPLQVEARYVRVRVLRRSVLALSEIVVYGHKTHARPAQAPHP